MPGGYADFDSFIVEEPRSRGLTKPIPVGQTIILSSLADKSVLAARDGKLQSVLDVSGSDASLLVIDRGKGRVALRTADGGYISVAGEGKAGDVTIKKEDNPGDAEIFQWVDMQRGDIMLMLLVTHRYLIAAPDKAGPVAADLPGPRPDRKDGSCFAWKLTQ